jgi:dinuclear metal center YbgI/SA1388 family protein
MIPLPSLVSYLNKELRLGEIADYANALNGLQMANRSGTVSRIIAAVDACLPVVKQAVASEGDLLLVHHGMFWSGLQPVVDSTFDKLAACLDGNLAIYSAHLPLDVHPVWGNNIQLTQAMGLEPSGAWMDYKGTKIGLTADTSTSLDDIVARTRTAIGGGAVHVCPGGPSQVKRIGIVTGGAGSEVVAAKAAGIDTLISGEGPHWSYTLAEELGINVLYAGHYATETFGVKALAAHLAELFELEWQFVDHPTGL